MRRWLAPLTPVYRLALALRELGLCLGMRPVQRLRWPVISVGNLSTGGAGKTPLTMALAQALARRGISIDVLSRGYGRSSRAVLRVNPNGTAEECGDEPLEMARATGAPVFVAAQRYEAGLLAESCRPDGSPAGVHLLDDGFQHRRLHRDADILLVNGHDLADRLLPAGNLREPLRALHRASCLAIPAEDKRLEAELKNLGWPGPVWRICRHIQAPPIDGPALAFCGIARPEQFFSSLEAAGIRLAARVAFADHHRYTTADVERLLGEAQKSGVTACITTEKDRVRMDALAEKFLLSAPLKTAALRVEIEEESAAIDWLLKEIAAKPQSPNRR